LFKYKNILEEKMKKILAVTLAAAMSVGMLCACGNEKKTDKESSESANAVFDFDFSVNGDEYTIPAPFDDFSEKGWTYRDDASETVPAHKYLINAYIAKDDMDPSVYIMNDSNKEITVTEGVISCISFDKFDMENNEIKLGDNITLGKSTIDDVKSEYGEPSSDYTNEEMGFTTLEYQDDVYVKVKFRFDDKSVLDGLELTNQPDF
jgi:hypothetical protein